MQFIQGLSYPVIYYARDKSSWPATFIALGWIVVFIEILDSEILNVVNYANWQFFSHFPIDRCSVQLDRVHYDIVSEESTGFTGVRCVAVCGTSKSAH